MENAHYYDVSVKWTGGKKGELSSSVLNEPIECATPPEFNGIPGIWSPEHLFTASVSSCFMSTFLVIAQNFKIDIVDFECNTIAKLERVDRKYKFTTGEIIPKITLANPDEDIAKVMRVLEKSKEACLITNSMTTEFTLKPEIIKGFELLEPKI